MKIYHKCLPYIIPHKLLMAILITITILSSSVTIISPYITGNFIDMLVENPNIQSILFFCVVYVCLNIFRIITSFCVGRLFVIIQSSASYLFLKELISHTQQLPLSYITGKDFVNLIQIQSRDTNNLVSFCVTTIQNVVINGFFLLATISVLLSLNPTTAFVVVVFLILYIFSYFAFKKPLYSINKLLTESQAAFFSKSFDQYRFLKFIKANSMYKDSKMELNKFFKDLYITILKNQKVQFLFSSTDGLIIIGMQVALFIIGGIQIINNQFTIGMFTIFLTYFNIMMNSVKYFFNFGKTYQEALVSYNRINEIHFQAKEENGNEKPKEIYSITLENLSFSYNRNIQTELKNINMKFVKGNIYAIHGKNGSGKSTLIDIILGFYIKETSGKLLFNDKAIENFEMNYLRKEKISVSLQEPVLLNTSIIYNISLKEKITLAEKDRIFEYAKMFDLENYITNFKNDIDTFLTMDNNNLSRGQKQKISILKVFFSDAEVMIFDEPTSTLDEKSTQFFINHLKTIKYNKIIICVTHVDIDADITYVLGDS